MSLLSNIPNNILMRITSNFEPTAILQAPAPIAAMSAPMAISVKTAARH